MSTEPTSSPYEGAWERDESSWPRRTGLFGQINGHSRRRLVETEPTRGVLGRLWEAGDRGMCKIDATPTLERLLRSFGMIERLDGAWVLTDAAYDAWIEWHRKRNARVTTFGSRPEPRGRSNSDRVARRLEEDDGLVLLLRQTAKGREELRAALQTSARTRTTVGLMKLSALGLLDRDFRLTDRGRVILNTIPVR